MRSPRLPRNFFVRAVFIVLLFCLSTTTVWADDSLGNKVQQFTLANGLTLLVAERHDSPTFTAYMTIGVGSVNEVGNNRGVAHLLEHMRFKGTRQIGTRDFAAEKPLLETIEQTAVALERLEQQPHADAQRKQALVEKLHTLQQQHRSLVVKDEFSQIYARHGGMGFNAFTGKDLTSYLVSLPANKLELWMSLEADRMQNAVLREFYTEREVVLEERRRSYESRPGGMMYEALLSTAFRVHPYRHPVIGWTSDIENLTLAETRDFLHRYYTPVNAVIAIVGDVDAEQTHQLVERYFGSMPPGEKIPPVTAVEPPQQGERRTEVCFDAEPQLLVAFHKPTLPSRDDYTFDLLGHLLTEGPRSRLYRSLVLEQQLATKVTSYSAPGARYNNLFVVSLTPRSPHTTAELERALYRELELLKQQPVSEQELTPIRKQLRADRLRYLKSNNGLANMLTRFQVVAGDWRYLVDYDENIARIHGDDLQQVAQRWLTKENRSVITLVQEADDEVL